MGENPTPTVTIPLDHYRDLLAVALTVEEATAAHVGLDYALDSYLPTEERLTSEVERVLAEVNK